jgi:type IV secretory pathway TrbD component
VLGAVVWALAGAMAQARARANPHAAVVNFLMG